MPPCQFPDYFKITPKGFKKKKKNQPPKTSSISQHRHRARAGGEGFRSFVIHSWKEQLLLSGSGSRTTARHPAAWQWQGSPGAFFHIDKCRKLNSAALGHLEEIQIIEAAELTINTLAEHSHSGADFCFCLGIFFIPTDFSISTGRQ